MVCTFPGYQSLYEVARSIGCRVSRWVPDEGSGWRFDLDQLRGHLRPDTRLIVVNFPHNPTGYLPSQEEYTELIELAQERDIYLLSDEMYRFLELESGSGLPSGCELYQQAFALSGQHRPGK